MGQFFRGFRVVFVRETLCVLPQRSREEEAYHREAHSPGATHRAAHVHRPHFLPGLTGTLTSAKTTKPQHQYPRGHLPTAELLRISSVTSGPKKEEVLLLPKNIMAPRHKQAGFPYNSPDRSKSIQESKHEATTPHPDLIL